MLRKMLLVGFVVLMLCGCVAQSQYDLSGMYKVKNFSAPLDQTLSAETGEAMFVEGEYIDGEVIRIEEPVDIMIPGSMGIPFPVHIDPSLLIMNRITSKWKYYCADLAFSAASFPGLGSVVRDGDCIGLRISHDGSEWDWAVDNSNYNRGHGTTIWTRDMSEMEKKNIKVTTSNKPFRVRRLERIVFDGYYGGQLHFSWEEYFGNSKDSKKFIFDYEDEPTMVGIRGNQFIVVDANNLGISYQWTKIN